MKRYFNEGEKVYIPQITYDGTLSLENGTATLFKVKEIVKETYNDETTLVNVTYEKNGKTAIIQVTADQIYKISTGRTCNHCGGQICHEHEKGLDYPFYCPNCDENMYGIDTTP